MLYNLELYNHTNELVVTNLYKANKCKSTNKVNSIQVCLGFFCLILLDFIELSLDGSHSLFGLFGFEGSKLIYY